MRPFRTVTYGKWILAGEHAVLRGCPALAFPLTARALTLEYAPAAEFDVAFAGPHGEELKLLFFGVLENAFERLGRNAPPTGHFRLDNALPVGAGLGASAALCGAVARWCHGQDFIAEADVYEFARKLEDLFHGESSGVDVAVSLGARGVRFTRQHGFTTLEPRWWPELYLSYSGQRGMTSDCVDKVKRLFTREPARAARLDQQMRDAVQLAERALCEAPAAAAGAPILIEALRLARGCFEDWGLCQGEVARHLGRLELAGAAIAKPTGSGGGGYVLSLWSRPPPDDLREDLMSITKPNL